MMVGCLKVELFDLYPHIDVIFKNAISINEGKVSDAATVMNEGRMLDLSDRYINTKVYVSMCVPAHIDC